MHTIVIFCGYGPTAADTALLHSLKDYGCSANKFSNMVVKCLVGSIVWSFALGSPRDFPHFVPGRARRGTAHLQDAHYARNKVTMNDSTRKNRVKNKDGVTARRRVSRAAAIARRETTSKPCSSEKFGELQPQIPNLQHLLRPGKDVLPDAPDGFGITVEDGEL